MLQIDKELVQWETERTLTVSNPNVVFVEFYNKNSEVGLVVPVVDGAVWVPNILLTENLPIIAFGCTGEKNKAKAISQKVFKVITRTKPADYVYTETEVLSYRALEERITTLEEYGIGSVGPQGPQGPQGPKGDAGYTPIKGKDYFDGKDGTSVTITKVTESTEEYGNNVVEFSDGKTLTVKNGKNGEDAIAPDAIRYSEQKLTDEKKAQARKNIGAMQNGVADSDLDMAYHGVKNVEAISLIKKNIDGEETGGVRLSCYDDMYDEDGKIVCGWLEFSQKDNNMPVILRRLYPGILDNDAVTVGQLNAAKAEIMEQILAELPDGDEVSY